MTSTRQRRAETMIAALLAATLIGVPPGALNPAVTQGNVASTICHNGWAKTIRPPVRYTNHLKVRQMAALGMHQAPSKVEEDHFIPLELGGSPTDPNNLWSQPRAGPCGARAKDGMETRLKRKVCAGTMSLAAAQAEIRAWPAHCSTGPR